MAKVYSHQVSLILPAIFILAMRYTVWIPPTRRFAQGLVNYSAPELHAIMGQHTAQIAKILGHKEYDEVIHRDNLVLL